MQRCARRPSVRLAARPAARCVVVRCAPRCVPPLQAPPRIKRTSALPLLRPVLLRKTYSTSPEPPTRAAIVREKAGDTTRTFQLRDDKRELSFTVEPRTGAFAVCVVY